MRHSTVHVVNFTFFVNKIVKRNYLLAHTTAIAVNILLLLLLLLASSVIVIVLDNYQNITKMIGIYISIAVCNINKLCIAA